MEAIVIIYSFGILSGIILASAILVYYNFDYYFPPDEDDILDSDFNQKENKK